MAGDALAASAARASSTPANVDFQTTHEIEGAETSSLIIMKRNIMNTDRLIKEVKLYKHKCEQLSSEIESVNKQKRALESSCQDALIEQIDVVKTNKELKTQLEIVKQKLLTAEINENSFESHRKQLEGLLVEREIKLGKMVIDEKNIKSKHRAKAKDLREKHYQASKKLKNQILASQMKILELYKFILCFSKAVPIEKLSKLELQFLKRCEKKYNELNCSTETDSSKKSFKYCQVEEFKDNVFSPLSCVSVDSGRSSFHSDDVKCQDSQIFPIEDLDDAFVPLSFKDQKTVVDRDTSPISMERVPNMLNNDMQFCEKKSPSFQVRFDQSSDDEILNSEVRRILETYRSVSLISPFPLSETEDEVKVKKSKKKTRMIIKRPKKKRKRTLYDPRCLIGVVREEMKFHRQYLTRRIVALETKVKELSDQHSNFDVENSRKVQNIINSDSLNTCSLNSTSSQCEKEAEVTHEEHNLLKNNCDTNVNELNTDQNISNQSSNKTIRKSKRKCEALFQQRNCKVEGSASILQTMKENDTPSKRKFEHKSDTETPRKRRNVVNRVAKSPCVMTDNILQFDSERMSNNSETEQTTETMSYSRMIKHRLRRAVSEHVSQKLEANKTKVAEIIIQKEESENIIKSNRKNSPSNKQKHQINKDSSKTENCYVNNDAVMNISINKNKEKKDSNVSQNSMLTDLEINCENSPNSKSKQNNDTLSICYSDDTETLKNKSETKIETFEKKSIKYLKPRCYVNRKGFKNTECNEKQNSIEINDKHICSKDIIDENFTNNEEKNCNDVHKNVLESTNDKSSFLDLNDHRRTIVYDDLYEDLYLEHEERNEKSTLFSSIIKECFNKEGNIKHVQNITAKTSAGIKEVCDILIECLTMNISMDKLNELVTRVVVCEDIVIANAIIEFISEERISIGTMIHIPLLPEMPYIQQTCLCFMRMLDKTMSTKHKDVFEITMRAIEYKSFKLGFTPSIECLCLLTKFYAVLCHVTKQNDRLRVFCIDALYCLTFKAIPVVSVAIQSWPYLFPKHFHRTAKDPLVVVLIHLVSMFYDEKLACYTDNIKFHLKVKYGYEIGNTTDDQMLATLTGYLKDVKNPDSLKTAFILFGKRRNAEWCCKRLIIDTLIPFIDNPSTNTESKAFAISLIGPLIKPFPTTMRLQCEVITKKLIAILESEVLPLIEEALIYSLTFLAGKNHNYQILDSIIKWKPTYSVSEGLLSRLNILVRSRNFKFWKQRIS